MFNSKDFDVSVSFPSFDAADIYSSAIHTITSERIHLLFSIGIHRGGPASGPTAGCSEVRAKEGDALRAR